MGVGYRVAIAILLLLSLVLIGPATAAQSVVTAHSTLSARQNWELTAPRDYGFVLDRRCYCAGPNRVRIQVRDGKVAAVEDLDTGKVLTDPASLRQYPTIDQVLEQIDQAMTRHPDNLTITYDRHLGYPARVYIDYSYRMADDEVDYRISDVVIGPAVD